jgi:hypothetical protein
MYDICPKILDNSVINNFKLFLIGIIIISKPSKCGAGGR